MAALRMSQLKTLVVMVMVVTVVQLQELEAQGGRPTSLILYAHESRVPPTNTLTGSAAPNGNLTQEQFGLIKTVSNTLRAGPNNESMVVGSQVGIVVLGKDLLDVFITYTYYLNNASGYGASTIAVHGHIDARSQGNRAFAVVGGTGLFLGASGQDISPFDALVIDESHSVNTHNLTLLYPFY